MKKNELSSHFYGSESIGRILLKIAPPVMLAQLIQALYNIVDSLFVASWAEAGLTALSIIYPAQLLMIALAVGTGVGVNTAMAASSGAGNESQANVFAGVGTPLAAALWALFAAVSWVAMPLYALSCTSSPDVIDGVVVYGRIVCVLSLPLFLESMWSKILQARGDMKTPMVAQILGAAVNIALDPLLIFGYWGFPQMGIAGAAAATVVGQAVAALWVMKKAYHPWPSALATPKHFAEIFHLGIPNILMQSAYTFYIYGLNLILSGFSDQAVTALGIYYKWMTFFFIPLGTMQTCIVPVISYNYAARCLGRCKKTVRDSIIFGIALIGIGTLCFTLMPETMVRVFSEDSTVVDIGRFAFPFIGVSFIGMVTSLIFPVFFQSVGSGITSSMLTIVRTVVLFVPLGYVFSRFGLEWFWLTFPTTEALTSLLGYCLYRRFFHHPYVR